MPPAPMLLQCEKPPLLSGLSQEWGDMDNSDVIIRCSQGQSVLSHKMVLASLSPEMLKDALLERDESQVIVLVPDVDAKSLGHFLQRVYQGGEEEASLPEDLLYLGIDLPCQLDQKLYDDDDDVRMARMATKTPLLRVKMTRMTRIGCLRRMTTALRT